MKAKDLDKIFDDGEVDINDYLDLSSANKTNKMKDKEEVIEEGSREEEVSWAYRVFSVASKGEVRYGLKRVFLNGAGEIIDWDKKFVVNPVFSSYAELKEGVKTFLEDLSTREGKRVMSNPLLNKAYKKNLAESEDPKSCSIKIGTDIFNYG